ncbi:MAG: pilus assembly protein [Pseudonocardia sp.]|nr:pilus assembly protein [Pseudonocardia sp.]
MTTAQPAPGRGQLRQILRDDDRGSATAELAVATPLLLLMLMLIVQFALWSHASHVAQAAAAQGLGAARMRGGTGADGTREARELLAQLAGGPLGDPLVETTRDATSVTVTVRGTVTPVVPFLVLPVRAVAVGPVERFTPADRPVA